MTPIPERMKRFPLFRGRYPIHFTVFVGPDGQPQFKVLARARQIEAINKNLCHLCGQRFVEPPRHEPPVYYFIGGPNCAKHRNFIDGPMHLECARYAAAACPFLSNPNARYSAVEATKPEHVVHNEQAAGELRPGRMCIAGTLSYAVRNADKQYPEFVAGEWVSVDWDTIPQRITNDDLSVPGR